MLPANVLVDIFKTNKDYNRSIWVRSFPISGLYAFGQNTPPAEYASAPIATFRLL